VQVIVAVGGEDDKVVLRSVECYDPVCHQWHTLACLPFAVRYCKILILYETFLLLNYNFLSLLFEGGCSFETSPCRQKYFVPTIVVSDMLK